MLACHLWFFRLSFWLLLMVMDLTNFINKSRTSGSDGNRTTLRYLVSVCVGKFLGTRAPSVSSTCKSSVVYPKGSSTESSSGSSSSSQISRTASYALAKAEIDIAFEFVRSTERGLSFKEAEKRRREQGPYIPLENSFPNWHHLLWRAFFHPFNIILVVMAVLSYLAEDKANGTIMLMLVLISVGLRFHQDYSSSMSAKHLCELLKTPVRVQRCAGRIEQIELVVQIDQGDVVPGDIIHFSSGDIVPGDTRLITSKGLVVSQSSLTGESGIVEKTANIKEDLKTPLFELKNICFMGTNVISGTGIGLVISTGSNTYISTILSKLGKQQPPDAFDKGVKFISYTLICIMVVAVPALILSTYLILKSLSESIIFGFCVAVVLTPQMLPLIVNTNLARGAVVMARNRCIVKSISAIQNMGAMDVLCIDKTGTLTMDHFIMVHHLDIWGFPSETVLKFAFLNSYFKTALKGPVDDAILAHAYTNGYRFHASAWRKIDEFPFDFTRRRISVVIEAIDMDVRYIVTKGSFEEVLHVSTFMECANGGVMTLPLTINERSRLIQMNEEMNNDGLVVLGVAIRKIAKTTDTSLLKNTSIESDMTFLGLTSFIDPPKDSAKHALHQLSEKGISPKILTGDSLSLAIKVCKEVGIATTHTTTGADLDALDGMEFHEAVKRATIFARLTPTQKLHVVQSLQKHGNHIVGYLGDGINDSLALNAANVGISVDSGANITKKSADIILLEKDLNVLVFGVEYGRLTYGNTMKYIKLSLVANFSSMMSLFVVTIFMRYEPLSPRQLLIQNFIYSIGQIAIPWDKMEDGYARTPQIWSWKELPIFMLWNGPVCSIFDISTFMFVRLFYRDDNVASSFFNTAWFVESLVMQALIIHMIRTTKIPFLQDMSSWPVLVSTLAVCAIAVVIPYTLLGQMMGLTQLPLSYFGFLTVLFLGYFLVGQVVKRIYIRVNGRWL